MLEKNNTNEKRKFLILILLIFIAGEALGIFLIRFFFVKIEAVDFKMLANTFARQYENEGIIDHDNDLIIRVYDEDKTLLWSDKNDSEFNQNALSSTINFDKLLKKYNSTVFNNKIVCNLEHIEGLRDESLVIAIPVYRSGEVSGALYLLHAAKAYSTSLFGFIIIFTFSLILAIFVIYYYHIKYIKKSSEIDQMRRHYVANISHELKSPIASIKALTETLADGLVTDEVELSRYYGVILSESNHLEKLVNDILELSRLQSDVIKFNIEETDAATIADYLSDKYELICEDSGINFEIDNSFYKLKNLYTDVDRIKQILGIIINNAMKFINEDGKIKIFAKDSEKYATIYISDDGIGMSEEMKKHIFERFYKSTNDNNKSGSGLGMAIMQEILSSLKEKYGIESKENAGTTIWFTIAHKKL
ncbi:MAG: HAMP domain-containing histidine kinase [Lachnospiraceae bacterium]|nr:HAMP domain-containing histidine kinase [Lachnospiraceae bacterium]